MEQERPGRSDPQPARFSSQSVLSEQRAEELGRLLQEALEQNKLLIERLGETQVSN